ncbi:Dicer-like protein 4 [Sesbania bispinosa]|nr:Dicer-like protein 4 [Sesbania bispinosa]
MLEGKQTWTTSCSNRPKVPINLKLLPPIDPSSITNFSKSKMSNSSSRVAVDNVLRQINNEEMELVDCDEGIVQNPTLENIAVGDASLISPNQKNANTAASLAQIDSENEGLE